VQDWIYKYNEILVLVVGILGCIAAWLALRKKESPSQSQDRSAVVNASDSQVAVSEPTESPVTDAAVATGAGITQHVNSHNVSYTIPHLPSGAPGRERSDEWRELVNELHDAFGQIGYAFIPLNVITPGHEENDYEAGIRRGHRAIRNNFFIADVLTRERISEKYQGLVEYARLGRTARPYQPGCPTMDGFDLKTSAFEDELMAIARADITQSSPGSKQLEPPKAERPEPNFVFVGGKRKAIFINPVAREGICDACTVEELEKAVDAFVLKFENRKPENHVKIGRALNVIAKMKFHHQNGVTGRDIDYGVWLNSSCNSTDFGVGDTRELVLACDPNGTFVTFEDRRTDSRIFAHGFGYFDSLEIEGYDRVDITLIDQNSQVSLRIKLKFWREGEDFYWSQI
jgi:hypothetical protein